jgi:hypothetical protein
MKAEFIEPLSETLPSVAAEKSPGNWNKPVKECDYKKYY